MSDIRTVLLYFLTALLLSPGPFARAADDSKIPAAGASRVNPKDGAEMVYVPAGDFLMGDTDQKDNPRRTVTLDAFWIYKNDVTVEQYRKFCKETGRAMPLEPDWGWLSIHPVVNVTWDDARAYCAWAGAALPTEAQWEKAARGTDGRLYPWGNQWDVDKAWCSQKMIRTGTAPVGSCPAGASPYGCLDMLGNVMQWCADWYDVSYPKNAPATNPTGPDTGDHRVLRGGTWSGSFEAGCRTADRHFIVPTHSYNFIGFRAARADFN